MLTYSKQLEQVPNKHIIPTSRFPVTSWVLSSVPSLNVAACQRSSNDMSPHAARGREAAVRQALSYKQTERTEWQHRELRHGEAGNNTGRTGPNAVPNTQHCRRHFHSNSGDKGTLTLTFIRTRKRSLPRL